MNELTAKQESFCLHYITIGSETFGNGTRAAIAAGYAPRTAEQQASRLLSNVKIKDAIERFKASARAKVEYNYEQAIKDLDLRLEYLEEKASQGNIQAIQAQTAILREKNAIAGLHLQKLEQTGQGLNITINPPKPKLEQAPAIKLLEAKDTD
ncbi:MAG: terminase small subunit [Planctomycetota bacterium]|jgi:phage terminase small subunit